MLPRITCWFCRCVWNNHWNFIYTYCHYSFCDSWLFKSEHFFWCVFYFRTAGWWSLCGGVVTTATPNTFRPYLGWSCTMHSCGPETWKTIGLCPLNQPAHGVTSGASTLKANWREKEREIYWETKREKDRTIREIKSKRQTERESCNSVPSGL